MIFLFLVLLSAAACIDADCGEGGCCFCDAEGQVIPYGFQANRCYSNYVCKCRFQDDRWMGFCLNGARAQEVGRIKLNEKGSITDIPSVAPTSEASSSISLEETEKQNPGKIMKDGSVSPPSKESSRKNPIKIKSSSTNTKIQNLDPQGPESLPISSFDKRQNTKPTSVPLESTVARQNLDPSPVPRVSTAEQQNLNPSSKESSSVPSASTVPQYLNPSSKGSSPVPEVSNVASQNLDISSKASSLVTLNLSPKDSNSVPQNLDISSKGSSSVPGNLSSKDSSSVPQNLDTSSKGSSSVPRNLSSKDSSSVPQNLDISSKDSSSVHQNLDISSKGSTSVPQNLDISSKGSTSVHRNLSSKGSSSVPQMSTVPRQNLDSSSTGSSPVHQASIVAQQNPNPSSKGSSAIPLPSVVAQQNLSPFSKKSSPVPQASTAAKHDVKPSSKVFSSLPVTSTKTQPITKLHNSKPSFSSQTLNSTVIRKTPFKIMVSSSNDESIRVSSTKEESTKKLTGCRTCSKVQNHFENDEEIVQTLDSTAIRKTPFKINNGNIASSTNDESRRVSSTKEESTEKLSECRTCSKVQNHFENDKRKAKFSQARKNCLYRAKNLCCAANENCGKDLECYFYCCNGACSGFYN